MSIMSRSTLRSIINKTSRKTIGVMSGTSADGVDLTLCEVDVASRRLVNVASETTPYPDALRDKILAISVTGSINLAELMGLSTYLGHYYADCIEEFCALHALALSEIDLIGSHGQTIGHLSEPIPVLDRQCRGTLQIGDGDVIAKRLGVVTVSDFRAGDIAVGGSGAPLVPLYHQLRFAKDGALRVVVNIGGIGNITALSGMTECCATDTGPGNCLVDTYMRKTYRKQFDGGGMVAQSGSIDQELLGQLGGDTIFNRTLPTTYDRKEVVDLLERYEVLSVSGERAEADVVATLSELTVRRIYDAALQLMQGKKPETVLVCGGGGHNKFFTARLQRHFGGAPVISTGDFGSDPDFVEAEAFAYLANLAVEDQTGNLPGVTGAQRGAILGKISQP
jgi:anhydro-N-acetylmuramic acid kinase